jgi:hypothetical protein
MEDASESTDSKAPAGSSTLQPIAREYSGSVHGSYERRPRGFKQATVTRRLSSGLNLELGADGVAWACAWSTVTGSTYWHPRAEREARERADAYLTGLAGTWAREGRGIRIEVMEVRNNCERGLAAETAEPGFVLDCELGPGTIELAEPIPGLMRCRIDMPDDRTRALNSEANAGVSDPAGHVATRRPSLPTAIGDVAVDMSEGRLRPWSRSLRLGRAPTADHGPAWLVLAATPGVTLEGGVLSAGVEAQPERFDRIVLDADDVRPELSRIRSRVAMACPARSSKVEVTLEVRGSDGRVVGVEVQGARNPKLEECVADAVRGTRFPTFRNDSHRIRIRL